MKKAYEINYRHPHLSSNFDFKKQWKAKLLPRLRLFGWRLFFNILPSADVLIARSISVTTSCVFCKNGDETLIHIFNDCGFAGLLWFHVLNISSLDWQINDPQGLISLIFCE